MAQPTFRYPRVAIEFCTACKWNLRAAWFAQELLSTFGNDVGEVAMLPASGGTFKVRLVPAAGQEEVLLWDRKEKGGFPDSKDLKRLVRDVLFPSKDLGHVDRHAQKPVPEPATSPSTSSTSAAADSQSSSDDPILDDNGNVCVECNAPGA
ncbi:seleno protein domain-containing protein [Myxozyma melibiosi]|uniref:Seleno protein domain-containing protein n=1 Tax=Myxozyma melibiosi TaxID=54550 RepID=A0ABR1F8G0_9ASCO